MVHFQDFSSLLQLGVGLGIGLSVFRAPVDIRTAKISGTLDGEIGAIKLVPGDFAKKKRRDLVVLKLKLVTTLRELDAILVPCMVIAVLMAASNMAVLVWCSLDAQKELPFWGVIALLCLAVGSFLLLLAFLEVVARWKLGSIESELSSIQMRQP